MDVISISDSTDGSVAIHSLLFHYSGKNPVAVNESSLLLEEPVSLSSGSTERCPVSWRTKQKKKFKLIKTLMSEKTPCASAKVESWLTHNNREGNFNALQLEAFDSSTVLSLEPLKQGGSILIRHDYNKDMAPYMNAKPYHHIFSAQNLDSEVICLDSDDDKSVDKVEMKKQKQKKADVPLSPETQKKNELCSYLQLMNMNCPDKKIGGVIQNRRSVRVLNLNMLSERKKLEKELLFEASSGSEKDLARKSFAELKIDVPKESESVNPKNNFLSVSALPRDVLEHSVDFDEAMREFFDVEKITVAVSHPRKTRQSNRCDDGPFKKKLRKTAARNSLQRRNLTNKQKYNFIKAKEKERNMRMTSVFKKRKLLNSMKANRKLRQRNTDVTADFKKSVPVDSQQQQNVDAESNVTSVSPSQQKRSECSPKRKLEHKEGESLSKSVKAFKEKDFCIIDLSHQHDYAYSDTLLDHNYASKPQIDKNYIMNVIVGQPFVSSADETGKKQDAFTITVPEQQTDDFARQTSPTKPKANGQQTHHAVADEEKPVKKKKLIVSPLQFNYKKLSNELNITVNNNNKIFADDNPPANIFEDSAYFKSPVSLSDTCVKEILHNLETDSNNEEGSPIIGRKRTHYIPLDSTLQVKPLHKSLMRSKRKLWPQSADSTDHTWDDKALKKRDERRSYSVQISRRNGPILSAFYLDFNLIIAQEQVISFWSQSALGNMLGAQNMWISKGSVQRLISDGSCVFKKSPQAVISLENSVAYVELWIKEHKSDKRERPVADIFATIYFCRHRLNGPDKKVLQLENINGIASDIQYVVLRNSRNIIVSWSETCDNSRKTYVHCYNLASDYQTVVSIREMGSVGHYIRSLHNIEDCDTLIMGCGEHKVSLWNVEYSYVVATIEINDIQSEPSTLWVKCDRGFLFMLQFYELENMFKLIAINGIHHSWKRLQVFTYPSGYKTLRGVCLDNNILGAFYGNGIVCWNIQTGESVIEEMCSENVYIPSEKHIIILSQNGILVRHALSHLITNYDL